MLSVEKQSDAVHWDNSIRRPAGQNSNHCGYPAPFSGNNDPLIVNAVNSENLNNMHRLPRQENAIKTLPKDCIQQRKPTANFGPSDSHQAELDLCRENHANVFKSPFPPAQNVQSMSESVSRIHKSVSHRKTKHYFVTVSEDNTGLGFVAENVVLAEDQMVVPDNLYTSPIDNGIRPFSGQFGQSSVVPCSGQAHQRDACLPKGNHHQKNVHQKAIAVVSPLAQHVVACANPSQNTTKANERDIATRLVPDEQSRANEHWCELSGNAAQTHKTSQEMPSESSLDTGFSQRSDGPVKANDLHKQRGHLNSMPLGGIRVDAKVSVQSPRIENQSSAVATAVNEQSETGVDTEPNRWSSVPVTEWSLQKLQTLVVSSEQRQKKTQTKIPFTDLSSEIIKLYWSGDSGKLCEAVKSDLYSDIMNEVRLHRGSKDSVILHEIPKEKLEQIAERFQILKHDSTPPETIRSSFCNLNENSSSQMTFQNAPKVADVEVMEVEKNLQVTENEKTRASHEASTVSLSFSHRQSRPSATGHGQDGVLIDNNDTMITDLKNQCTRSIRETIRREEPLLECLSKQSSPVSVDNCRTVTETNDGELFSTKDENSSQGNKVPLPVTLNKQSPAVSDDCVHAKPEDLLKLPETKKPLDDWGDSSDSSDPFAFIQIKVLSPKTAKKMTASELDGLQKDVSVQTVIKKSDQFVVKPCDWMSEDEEDVDAKKSPAEKDNRNCTTGQLQKYCCLDKWFHVLGYATDVVCKCKKKTELCSGNDVSGNNMMRETSVTEKRVHVSPILGDASLNEIEIVDVSSDCEDALTIENAVSEQLVDKPLTECGPDALKAKEKHYRCNAYQKKRTHLPICGASKADFVPSPSNDVPQTDLTLPVTCTDNTNLQCDEKGNETSTLESQKEGRIVNLALYGHNRSIMTNNSAPKRIRSSDKGHFPPATINIRVSPCLNNYGNNHKSQTIKQRILKSWRNSYVPTKIFTDSRSKKLNSARETKSKMEAESTSLIKTGTFSTAFDAMGTLLSHQDLQTRGSASARETVCSANQRKNPAGQSKDKSHLASGDKTKTQKHKGALTSININTRQKESKLTDSSPESPHTSRNDKQESQRDVTLDFKVLPESFSFTEPRTMTEDGWSASTEFEMPCRVRSEKLKTTTLGNPGIWCVSPRRKAHHRSALASNVSVSSSTFQEFKRRYEEKKQRLFRQ